MLVSGSVVDGSGDHTGGGTSADGVGHSQLSGGSTARLLRTGADGGGEWGRDGSADDLGGRDRARDDDRG